MTFLDVFALLILAVLLVIALVVVAVLGSLPGRVAHSRKHPQAGKLSRSAAGSACFSAACIGPSS